MAKELVQRTGAKQGATVSTVEKLMHEGEKKEYKERKTEHPSLSIEPSLWADFKLLAKAMNTTPNALFADLVRESVESNNEKLQKYKELIGA